MLVSDKKRRYLSWSREEELVVRAVLAKEPRPHLATPMARDALMAHQLSVRSLASVASYIQKLRRRDLHHGRN